MEYRGAQETASAWEVSTRLVQRLCAEGRVDGARKVGGSWVIPLSTQKPADLRLAKDRDAGHCPEDVPASASLDKADDTPLAILGAAVPPAVQPGADALAGLMPLMNSAFVPGACCEAIESIEDLETREIARAEYYYFSGRAEEAARASSAFLSHPDLATRLSAHLIYAYANLSLGNINSARFALAELRLSLHTDASSSPQSRIAEAFVTYAASVLLHLPAPDDMPPAETFFALLPPGLRAFALYMHAHRLYLEGDYSRSLGLVEAALLMMPSDYPIPEIYLHLVAVMDHMSLRQTDAARTHLLAAWALARPDGLIEAFGEHHGLLGGMLESVIKKDWPEDFKRIIDITYRFSAGWRRIHNPVAEETVADNLTTTEFAVSMLAARDWTNQEIGAHLGVSANTVKSCLSSSFRKLGISRRRDLQQYMLR